MNSPTPKERSKSISLLAERNGTEIFQTFKVLPNSQFHTLEDKKILYTGIQHPLFNGVYEATFSAQNVDQKVDETLNYFIQKKTPMMWWCGPRSESINLREKLMEKNLIHQQAYCMAMETKDLPLTDYKKDHTTIKVVKDISDIKDYTQVFVEGFQVPESLHGTFFKLFETSVFQLSDTWTSYIAYKDNLPVSIVTTFEMQNSIGIYNVSTIKKYQGQGISSMLLYHVALINREKGVQYIVGSANEVGFNMYKRLGGQKYSPMDMFILM